MVHPIEAAASWESSAQCTTASFGKNREAVAIDIPSEKVIRWPETVNNGLIDSAISRTGVT